MGLRSIGPVCVAILTVVALAQPASAGLGVDIDYSGLIFDYDVDPGFSGMVGQMAGNLVVDAPLVALGRLVDLGADQAFGGAGADADTIVDNANTFSAPMNVILNLDIFLSGIDGMGDGIYTAVGTIEGYDFTGALVYEADVASVAIELFGDNIHIEGAMSTMAGNDAILLPAMAGDDFWVYTGQPGSPAPNADGDALMETITVPMGRANYDTGVLVEGTFKTGIFDIDEVFDGDVDADFSNFLEVQIIPAPAAWLLGVMGLGLVGWIRRRVG